MRLNRRSILRQAVIGLSAVAMAPIIQLDSPAPMLEFPKVEKLGRVVGGKIDVRTAPSPESKSVKFLYDDAVVIWNREVIGAPNLARGKNRRWVETPDGFIYAPDLQLCRNKSNEPLKSIPSSLSGPGIWAEVTVPYLDAPLANPPAKSEVIKQLEHTPRLYYSQVYWIDDLRQRNGIIEYHVVEKHGSPGDTFWADARGLRPIFSQELAPLSPEVVEKKILVNIGNQTMACFEGKREVYFCRVSTGAKFDATGNAVDKWSTPVGLYHSISRKFISLHMAGGNRTSGYEVFGVGWTSFFATGGFSIHSTYWHSNFGEPMSHGCVNVMPDDARFVFLWSAPQVPYDPGKLEISGYDGTSVEVVDV